MGDIMLTHYTMHIVKASGAIVTTYIGDSRYMTRQGIGSLLRAARGHCIAAYVTVTH